MATVTRTITQWSGRVSKSWLPSSTSFSSTSSTPTSDSSGGVRISSPSSGTNNAYTCCMVISPNVTGTVSSITFNIKMYDANSSSSTYYYALCPYYPSSYGTQSGTTYYESNSYGYTSKSISSGSSSNSVSVTISGLSLDGTGTYYLYIYTHSTSDIGIVYKSSSSHTFTATYTAPVSYSWKSLGSGTASSVSFSLSDHQVGYYLYTPSSNGTLTIYSSGASDSYGGIGINGNLSLSSDSDSSGSSIVTGTEIDYDDDSAGSYQFQCSDVSVSSGTTYRIYVHNYSGGADSGTLYMSFTATKTTYTVTFNANGGSGAPSALSCTIGGTITIPSTKPTRSSRIFLGWSTSSSAVWANTTTIIGATYTPSADTTLYAIWGYILTINPNGGTAISGSTSEGSTSTTSTYTVGFTKTATYGRWLGNFAGSRYLYTATGNFNQPIRTGYTFTGWTVTSGNGSVVHADAGDTFTSFYDDNRYCYIAGVSSSSYGYYYYINNETSPTNSTITAQWTGNTYYVAYNANGGSGTMSNSTHIYGTAKTLTANAFTRTGYTFAGWSTSSTATAATYTNQQSVSNLTSTSGATVTLYAVWTANTYTVAYNANGGSGTTMTSSSHTYGVAKTLTANTYTRTGYRFAGWSKSSTATSATYTDQQSVSNLTSTNGATITLYAVWTANTYTIQYDANGGAGTMASSSHTYGTSKALTANAYTRLGYTFIGWSKSATATTATYTNQQSVSNLTSTHGGTVILYAVWEPFSNMYIYSDGAWHKALKYIYHIVTTSSTRLHDDYSGMEYEGSITYEVGQTWTQWCNSKYNTPGLYCSGGYVYGPNGTQLWNMAGNAVLSTDIINSNGYEFI